MTRSVRFFGIVLAFVAVILVITLCTMAIISSRGISDTAAAIEEISNRRSVTIDALAIQAEQNECVDRTQSEWMLALTLALQHPTNSPERDQAFLAMANIAEDLRTINRRCYQENPVPTVGPDDDQSSRAQSTPQGGEDGRDGVDGRNGRDGRDGVDGADSTTPGPAGTDGRDGTNGVDGKDGADSMVPGPAGPPGESIQGPPGETGAQGPPGFDGAPPIDFEFVDPWGHTHLCTDPDGDLHYSCAEVG